MLPDHENQPAVLTIPLSPLRNNSKARVALPIIPALVETLARPRSHGSYLRGCAEIAV